MQLLQVFQSTCDYLGTSTLLLVLAALAVVMGSTTGAPMVDVVIEQGGNGTEVTECVSANGNVSFTLSLWQNKLIFSIVTCSSLKHWRRIFDKQHDQLLQLQGILRASPIIGGEWCCKITITKTWYIVSILYL